MALSPSFWPCLYSPENSGSSLARIVARLNDMASSSNGGTAWGARWSGRKPSRLPSGFAWDQGFYGSGRRLADEIQDFGADPTEIGRRQLVATTVEQHQ